MTSVTLDWVYQPQMNKDKSGTGNMEQGTWNREKEISCGDSPPSPLMGRGEGEGWVWITLVIAWAFLMLGASPAGAGNAALPKTFKGQDPQGWGPFRWQMTQAKAAEKGAEPFVDAGGEKRFGLPSVELLPAKTFQVRLEFFSHMGLNAVQVSLAPHTECAQDVYETLLNDLRETHGKEMESRILDYPNAHYRSHDWIVGTTKIVLHHGCPEPGKATATQPTTHLWYEKRMEYEPWNR